MEDRVTTVIFSLTADYRSCSGEPVPSVWEKPQRKADSDVELSDGTRFTLNFKKSISCVRLLWRLLMSNQHELIRWKPSAVCWFMRLLLTADTLVT